MSSRFTDPAQPRAAAVSTAAGTTAATGAGTAARASAATNGEPSGGETSTGVPQPLRFPWLSRLAAELEPVAKQKPMFPTSPVLGDHVDQAV